MEQIQLNDACPNFWAIYSRIQGGWDVVLNDVTVCWARDPVYAFDYFEKHCSSGDQIGGILVTVAYWNAETHRDDVSPLDPENAWNVSRDFFVELRSWDA